MRSVCVAVVCLLVAATAVRAQVGGGQITGIVNDAAGAAVPGAAVTATNVATSATRTAISTSAGVYTLAGLPSGAYRIAVELAGFRPSVREGVKVETGETIRLDVGLVVGAVQESVTVRADAPLLRAATASLGEVVSQEKVTALPLNGRSFITLAALAPGVALPPPPAAPLPRINGGRPRTNEYLFDGISVLQPEPGQVAFFPIVDSIQEFKIESNSPPAEFGRFNGGVVNLTTKSGSNALHGTGFEFFRNEALNARNAFQAANAVKPEFRRNQYGGVLGGPLRRDRTFFFVDYQGQRQGIGRTVTSTVPTALQRQGIFSEADCRPGAARFTTRRRRRRTAAAGLPARRFPATRFRPAGSTRSRSRCLKRYPQPTSAGTANNYRRTDSRTGRSGSVRRAHRSTARVGFAVRPAHLLHRHASCR